MPTIVMVDVSLSMTRLAGTDEEDHEILDVAKFAVSSFFESLSQTAKQEYATLVVFSSQYEVLCKFTRDYEALVNSCAKIEVFDKINFEGALHGIDSYVMNEWGVSVPINIILVTDGTLGSGSLKHVTSQKTFPIPLSFPCHLSIVVLNPKPLDADSRNDLIKLIHMNEDLGDLVLPDGNLSMKSASQCFDKILNKYFEPYEGQLICGTFKSRISLFPPPAPGSTWGSKLNEYRHTNDRLDYTKWKVSNTLNIIGFLDIQDVSNPPHLSRHLVMPIFNQSTMEAPTAKAKAKLVEEEGKSASFCVMLHGSLKVEKMVAVVELGADWYGMLYSWIDQKKKSALTLTIFDPSDPFPWVGKMVQLGPALGMDKNPYKFDSRENAEETPFPVLPLRRRSYHVHTNNVWIKTSGLQSDVQKLMRYAKKLPDKQSAFFKEVNKVRRAGLCYGFQKFLMAIAEALENEGSDMPPEAAVQLRHVAEGLRNSPKRDLNKNIVAIEINSIRKTR